jgi:5'-3' exonuclease
MGIRFLNRYMKDHGFRGIVPSSMATLRGKKVIIDASIYLYRFKSTGKLMDGMDAFLRMFQQHHIHPIFVFDGPPRSNKKELLQERQKLKHDAWKQYNESTNLTEAYALKLKKTFTRISKQDVESVKEQLKEYKIQYIDAPHEADEVCAKLMTTGQVDACMSDDMDMFMYGCKWVIRDVDLTTQTMVNYYTPSILQQLGLTLHEFKQIGVLSGSDYYKSSFTLYTVMSMFHAFKRTEHTEFYEWVKLHYQVDVTPLWNAYQEYDISTKELIYTDAGAAF